MLSTVFELEDEEGEEGRRQRHVLTIERDEDDRTIMRF